MNDRTTNGASTKRRIHSVDLLRGVVMMIMLLDHTREFVHHGAVPRDRETEAAKAKVRAASRFVNTI